MTAQSTPVPPAEEHQHTVLEEIANAVTHGIGAAAALAGLVLLVMLAVVKGGPAEITALTIYGVTLFLLYLASTLYHSVRHEKLKDFFHHCDHACIFLLIAGTYTPLTLLVLGGGWGWGLLIAIWSIALFGIAFKFVAGAGRYRGFSVGLYLGMGWLGVIAIGPILASMDPAGVWLLALGGLAYTAGVPFYLWERLPFNHAVWHLFVLTGSACHFAMIALYTLPATA